MTHVGRFAPTTKILSWRRLLDKRGISYLGYYVGESEAPDREFIFAVSDGMVGQKSGGVCQQDRNAKDYAATATSLRCVTRFGVYPIVLPF